MSNRTFTIFEYDTIGTNSGVHAQVSETTYEWLESETLSGNLSGALKVHAVAGKRCLKAQSFVGVIQGPFREAIEILPKTAKRSSSANYSRALLINMLRQSGEIPTIETDIASMETAKMPLHESFIQQLIIETQKLIKRGVKSSYVRVAESSEFLKGKLNLKEQMSKHLVTAHRFAVEYDDYLIDRAENRVIKSALRRCLRFTKSSSNNRLLRELLFTFDEVKDTRDWLTERSHYSFSRDMKYYQKALSWSELVLQSLNPLTSEGPASAVSLLFPMEKVFEKYVGYQLNRKKRQGVSIRHPARSEYLSTFRCVPWFRLEPDFLISDQDKQIVIDTKWKILDRKLENTEDKFGISRNDMYQLYAYGMKYLQGEGDLFLVYPEHEGFNAPIEEPLILDDAGQLRLWIVSFPLRGLNRQSW